MAVTGGLVILLVWFYPSHTDFRPTNPFWNGLDDFAGDSRLISLASLALLPSEPEGTVVVVIPYRPVSGTDAACLKRYLEGGGVVVLMDDYGFGNQVLMGLGLSMRYAGTSLLDPLVHHANRWLPKITDISILPSESTIILNHATALIETAGMTVVARSSRYSFLDSNGNGRVDQGEVRGPFAVAAWTKFGKGVLFVISDPSLLINAMISLGDNRRFMSRVFQLAVDHPRVFLDEAHLPAAPIDHAKTLLRSAQAAIATPEGLLTVLVVGVVVPVVAMTRGRSGNARPR
jgi:hypothetical protein